VKTAITASGSSFAITAAAEPNGVQRVAALGLAQNWSRPSAGAPQDGNRDAAGRAAVAALRRNQTVQTRAASSEAPFPDERNELLGRGPPASWAKAVTPEPPARIRHSAWYSHD